MRLWSLHPSWLDPAGLVALWRESLLAQAVLGGRTRGYRSHPQLHRFAQCADPMGSIATYLQAIHAEAELRGYRFTADKIIAAPAGQRLTVTAGQLAYEWEHLMGKLRERAPTWLERLGRHLPGPHPLFKVVPGEVALWEVVRTPSRDGSG